MVRHGLTRAGRYLVLRTRVPDRPGRLVKLLELVAAERGNLLEVNHRREGFGVDVAETGVELTIVTRNEEHCRELVAALERARLPDRVGQPPQRLNATTSPSNVATPPGDDRARVEPLAREQRRGDRRARPALAHREDRLRAVECAAAELSEQPVRDVARARDVARVALGRFAHVDDLNVGGRVEELLQLDDVHGRERLLGARREDVAGEIEDADRPERVAAAIASSLVCAWSTTRSPGSSTNPAFVENDAPLDRHADRARHVARRRSP